MAERRRRAAIPADGPLIGVALSGGGIRSATFCLGLFQALARQNLIRRIDLLSTVSGGGYFGSFLGAAFCREDASAAAVERELANNDSWSVTWLRDNGRFLSPNGAGDNWHAAAVALRNWVAVHVVLLTFLFLGLGLAALIRADLSGSATTRASWLAVEQFFWAHQGSAVWWSPWLVLPVLPLVALLLPTGMLYWLTQFTLIMSGTRRLFGLGAPRYRAMSDSEFASRSQTALTRGFMIGLVSTVCLLGFALVDSLGQTAYHWWAQRSFDFPALWAALTGAGAIAFGFGTRAATYLERLLGRRGFRIPFAIVALGLALTWLLLIVLGLAVVACGLAWRWNLVWDGLAFQPMTGGWPLLVAVTLCFAASWLFSRSFGFVNLSSLQQTYTARLARAYLGATNPLRRAHANHTMTELIPGDDLPLEDYAPHQRGGPLHLINVTVNETISGKTQVERRDRKGVAMAVGPAGLSVATASHALWTAERYRDSPLRRLQALWDSRQRAIHPIPRGHGEFHALCNRESDPSEPPQKVEALALGRWVAISGAAFTTGTGANTELGLSLLLGLANVRLGYWWDSGITSGHCGNQRPNFLELASRVISRILPVQSCLMNEFFARFHGPGRRHWYLSDGGHFENTACYELVRRRVPFIVCTDAGQDPHYRFGDLANLVRKARTDFGAEIQIVRRAADRATDDPGVRYPLPKLEELVHPALLDVIGVPEDFAPLEPAEAEGRRRPRCRRHALLARIHYLDTDQFSWLLLIKPSLMGDEAADVVEYQHTHPLFPQEPTSDQYFDEAQWESYRKLGEHIGTELFTPPAVTDARSVASWSPSQMRPPTVPTPGHGRPAAASAVLPARLPQSAVDALPPSGRVETAASLHWPHRGGDMAPPAGARPGDNELPPVS